MAGRSNPGAHSPGVCGRFPQPPLPRQPHTAPLRRLPPDSAPWRRPFGGRHKGSTAENAAEQQPRGPLTRCLCSVPPDSACLGSRTPPAQAPVLNFFANCPSHARWPTVRAHDGAEAWEEPILCPALYPHGGWAHPSSLSRCIAEASNFFAFCSQGVQERGRTGHRDAVVESDARRCHYTV